MKTKNTPIFWFLFLAPVICFLFVSGFVSNGRAKSEAPRSVQSITTILPIVFKNFSPPPPEVCDRAFFMGDITIPDGTDISPGAPFVKTWQLRNDGFCPWTTDYRVIFVSGDMMSGPAHQPISTQTVLPGQTVDISIEFVAPGTPGTYQGYWKLLNFYGIIFGIGETNEPFDVLIDVVP